MKWLAISIIAFLITSCKQTAIEQKLSGTDSVMVQFFDENGMIYNAVTSTERGAIKKLTSFMKGRSVTPVKCSPSGKVQFFSKKQLTLDATYYYGSAECRYFSFSLDGKLQHVGMSNEAVDFLQKLAPPR